MRVQRENRTGEAPRVMERTKAMIRIGNVEDASH
jgi:hypothetical protein